MDFSDISDIPDENPKQNAQQQIQGQTPQQQVTYQPGVFPLNSMSLNPSVEPQHQLCNVFGPIPLPAPPIIQQQQQPQQFVPRPQQPGDIDIDSSLLQQFSCLGTTDHEDLINQLSFILNNQPSRDEARFFLEMNNWNLQMAVCCYLDYINVEQLPSMKIVEQTRPTESSQGWKLQNNGTNQWPNGSYLMSPNQTKRIQVPSIKPGETCDIVADIPLSSPPIMWRLCTSTGSYFGETIWMIPTNSEDTATDLAERMSQLRTTTPENTPQVNVVIIVQTVNMD